MTVTELVSVIEQQPDHPGWDERHWETALAAVPDWRGLVADRSHWSALDRARPSSDYDSLTRVLLRAAGMGLAIRWVTADDRQQRRAAEAWLRDNIDQISDAAAWRALTAYQRQRIVDGCSAVLEQILGQYEQLRQEYGRELGAMQRLGSRAALVDDHATGQYIRDVMEQVGDRWAGLASSPRGAWRRHVPTRLERELIARVFDRMHLGGYGAAALPLLIMSDDPPPLFVRYPELEADGPSTGDDPWSQAERYDVPRNPDRGRPEQISIEELLSVYQPADQTIIIYASGIAWYSQHRQPGADATLVQAVALVHQIAHWAAHALTREDSAPWMLEGYLQCELAIHEVWAQLLTWWAVSDVGGAVRQSFEDLNQHQPALYRMFREFADCPPEVVIKSLDHLRSVGDGAMLRDWRDVIEQAARRVPLRAPGLPSLRQASHVDRVGAAYAWVPATAGLDGFWMMRTPVTNALWRQAVEAGVCDVPRRTGAYDDPAKAQHPVVHVTRAMAIHYASWVGGRLPRDAEWTRAAQGDDGRAYPWGDNPPDERRANFGNNVRGTTPVDNYPPGASPYGVYDMAGNVWEMVMPDTADRPFIMRGGAYFNAAAEVRCDARLEEADDSASSLIGFRVIATDARQPSAERPMR